MKGKEEFVARFREIQPKFSRLLTITLGKADLTLPQFALLMQVSALGTIPMTEASEKLYLTKPAITNLVDRLEESAYLKRISHPKDRRVHLLQILPKGRKMVQEVQAGFLPILLKALAEFDSREQKIISRFYARLSENLEQALEKCRE